MEPAQDRVQRGFEQFVEMAGEDRARQLRDVWGQISPDFQQFVLGVLAGQVWTRSKLDLRTRSLVTIAGPDRAGKDPGTRAQCRDGSAQRRHSRRNPGDHVADGLLRRLPLRLGRTAIRRGDLPENRPVRSGKLMAGRLA